jgi:phosphate transport system protein
MASEVRGEFHRELDRLDVSVASLLGLIPEAVVSATVALSEPNGPDVDGLRRWQLLVGDMYADVEHTIEVLVALQSPVAGDLRFLLVCIRLVPGLHEVMDLIGEVAGPGRRSIGEHLTSRVRSLTGQLGGLIASVWEGVEAGWRSREARVVHVVRERIEVATDVRAALSAELGSGSLALPVALEMAVVARTFDRLGHHAQQSARLVASLAPRAPVDGLP